ncbi:HD domain-containing protein [Paenibacillus antri]|uniref:HD domain-containing protein n=1 Tax=Paenibacillus antri TaxID=2582848 RepID=A0A5R9G184_9BACL|nr:HD domain-containing protein [Paenibacillus antri]TLS50092.1 HD domain-containing protein [Paenibacillus antri]
MDYRLRLDGALDDLWEPLWRQPIRLFHEEKELMRSEPVRRLHYVRHGGASFINTHHTYSRLQHTLGVFALTARFEPENRALRAAALLHDAGHAPFSHTLDSIEGVDHHQWTREVIFSEEVANILSLSNVRPVDVMDYIDGTRRSLLRNKDGTLHADHLDSWVRSAYAGGYLSISTSELLNGINYINGSLEFTPEVGGHVVDLIWEEARMHGSTANIGINAMMRKLVRSLITKGKLDVAALPAMTDAHIEQLLRNDESTNEEYEKLLAQSWRIRVTREQPSVFAEKATLSKLYLALPLVGGISIAESSPDIMATMEELNQMLGTYYVWWG